VGANLGDRVARGYVTIDSMTACVQSAATNIGFVPGKADDRNLLTGSFTFVDRSAGLAYSGPLAHVEASATHPATAPGTIRYTFYSGYTLHYAPFSDKREPLGSVWQTRYVNEPAARTTLLVWQDPGLQVQPFNCSGAPPLFPLAQSELTAFDEQETAATLAPGRLGRVAARVDGGPGGLAVPFTAGFLTLDFNHASGTAFPPDNPSQRQAFVVAIQPVGAKAAAVPAAQIDNPALH